MNENMNFIVTFSHLFFFIFPDYKKWGKIKINKLIKKIVENIFF